MNRPLYGFGPARAARRHLAGGTPTPTPTDVRDGLVLDWDVDDLTGTPDAPYSGIWLDRVAGAPMSNSDSVSQPTLRTALADLGGRNALNTAGGRHLVMGRPTALLDALANNNNATGCTLVMICRLTPGVTGQWHALFSPSSNSDNRNVVMSASHVGQPNALTDVSLAGSPAIGGFYVVIMRSRTPPGSSNRQCSMMYNGHVVNTNTMAPHASADYRYGAASYNSNYGIIGEFADLRVYNRAISNAEALRLTKYFCHKFDQPLPWAGAPYYAIFDGDSYSSLSPNNWVLKLARSGRVFWYVMANMANPSRNIDQMEALIPYNFAGVAEEVGLPLLVATQEYYNQGGDKLAAMQRYLGTLRAALPSGTPIMVMDAWDNGQAGDTARATYNAGLAASTDLWDVLVPISETTEMGVEGACPEAGGDYTGSYFGDAVGHPSGLGTSFVADYWRGAAAGYTTDYWGLGEALL